MQFGDRAMLLAGVAGRLLGWRPHEFWASTPAELAAILQPQGGGADRPLSRSELDALMEQENG